jgi:hypothetical protein
MFPLTCPNGDPHDFQTSENSEEYVCTECGTSFETYNKADDRVREIKEAIKKVAEYSNGGDADIFSEAMLQAMHETHRTIQQNFFRGLVKFIDKMKDMPTDPRNQACVGWCREASRIDSRFPII